MASVMKNHKKRRSSAGLRVEWSKRGRALVYTGELAAAHLLMAAFETIEDGAKRTLAERLNERGYDVTTLRFEISRKAKR